MQNKVLKLGVLLSILAIAACDTVQGAGKDLQTAGQVVQQESAEVQAGL